MLQHSLEWYHCFSSSEDIWSFGEHRPVGTTYTSRTFIHTSKSLACIVFSFPFFSHSSLCGVGPNDVLLCETLSCQLHSLGDLIHCWSVIPWWQVKGTGTHTEVAPRWDGDRESTDICTIFAAYIYQVELKRSEELMLYFFFQSMVATS
jgi:hypothetical protein